MGNIFCGTIACFPKETLQVNSMNSVSPLILLSLPFFSAGVRCTDDFSILIHCSYDRRGSQYCQEQQKFFCLKYIPLWRTLRDISLHLRKNTVVSLVYYWLSRIEAVYMTFMVLSSLLPARISLAAKMSQDPRV